MHVGNGKGIVRAARDFGALVWAGADSASDALALKSSLRQDVPFSKRAGALEALKIEAGVAAKRSGAQIAPVEALLLLLVTLVVCVGGALECNGVDPALIHMLAKDRYQLVDMTTYRRCSLLNSGAQSQQSSSCKTHRGMLLMTICYNERDDRVDLRQQEICKTRCSLCKECSERLKNQRSE